MSERILSHALTGCAGFFSPHGLAMMRAGKEKGTMANETALMGLESVQGTEEVEQIQSRARTLAANAARITVKDAASAQKATDFLVEVKTALKTAEDYRKSFTKGLTEAKRNIDAFFKKITKPYAEAESTVKGKLRGYTIEQERSHREEEGRIRQENERRAAERRQLETEAEEKGEIPPEITEETAPIGPSLSGEPMKTVRGMEGGSASMKKVWRFEITDRDAIPDCYWVVDEKAIQKAVNLGAREIPGIHIYEDIQVAVRT